MIVLKSSRELARLKAAGEIAAGALMLAGQAVKPGVTTAHIDRIARDYIEKHGATPSFLGYNGFPASACISINNEVIHGIPNPARVLSEGDIVSIDLGAHYKGYHGDTAATFAVGEICSPAKRLMDTTRESLQAGIAAACAGGRVGDISFAVQSVVEARGYSVVRDFVGHGVGTALHEDPGVPNFGVPGRGVRLVEGMTLAIEPMVNAGGYAVSTLPDKWTVVTKDGSLSAHFEHSIAITKNGPMILTQV